MVTDRIQLMSLATVVSKRFLSKSLPVGNQRLTAQRGAHASLLHHRLRECPLCFRFLRLTAAFLFSALLLLPCFGPAHAQLSLGTFSLSDEIELGRKFNTMIRSRMPMVEDPEILGYVQNIVQRIQAHIPPQPFPLRVGVIRHNALNAFAGPGGHIFVHTGLLRHLDNESEFAGVIAHEMAHVTQRHIASRIEKGQFVNLAAVLGVLAGVFLGGEAQPAVLYGSMAAGQSAMLSYSRADEREADQVGMNYLIAAGFRPQGMAQSFQTIRRLRWLGGSIPIYLSTHPGVDERIASMHDRIEHMPENVRGRSEDNTAYDRARMLIMARYADPDKALAFFNDHELKTCLNILGRAIAQDRSNQIVDAEKNFEQALECAPSDALSLREAGAFFLRQGQFPEAIRHLQEAVLLNPRDQLAMFHYARALAAMNQENEAIALLKRILGQLPEQGAVHSLLGRIQGKQGNLFAAHLHLAFAATYENDKQQARFHLRKAEEHAQGPDDQSSLDNLRETYKDRKEFWQ